MKREREDLILPKINRLKKYTHQEHISHDYEVTKIKRLTEL